MGTANLKSEVEFVTAGGSEKIFASGVNFSIFTHFLCFFLLKLLKLGEIDCVKFLDLKSGGVKFWTNSMSESLSLFCTLYSQLFLTSALLPGSQSLAHTSESDQS